MVGRTHPSDGLLLTFERDGQEPDQQIASDGERACQMVVVLLARMGSLQNGDKLTVTDA